MNPKLILTFLLLLTSHLSLATIRYVSKTGSSTPPYTSWATASDSIQKCINVCQGGDTVIVANGIYNESIYIDKAINLWGSSADSTIIKGSGTPNHVVDFFQTNTVMKNFSVIGPGSNATGITGIYIWYSNVTIRNCKVSNVSRAISPFNSIPIMENLFISNFIWGIFEECPVDTCKGIYRDNIIISNAAVEDIVNFAFGGSPTFINNIVIEEGNTTINVRGVELESFIKGAILKNNLVSGYSNANIRVGQITTDTAHFQNNISLNSGAAFATSTGNRTKITNNIVVNSFWGVFCPNAPTELDYNLFWNVNNLTGGNVTLGDSNIVADPMFVNDTIPTSAMNFDFHLQKYSPAIDKGDPDILDVDGSRSDIGMFGGPYGQIYTYHDLAPKPPRNLTASVQGKAVTLKWNKNTEADLFRYRVYRDTVPNFIYDTTKIIGVTADTFFVDMLGKKQEPNKYYYKLTAIDSAINQSAASEEVQVTITGMAEAPPIVVEEYKLLQNYPNPFNPSTTIPYRLKSPAYVKVIVYNILGEMVRVLVNHHQEAGYYELEFAPNSKERIKGTQVVPEFETGYYGDIVSGIYLYRIEIIGEGNIPVFSDMKKMMMVK